MQIEHMLKRVRTTRDIEKRLEAIQVLMNTPGYKSKFKEPVLSTLHEIEFSNVSLYIKMKVSFEDFEYAAKHAECRVADTYLAKLASCMVDAYGYTKHDEYMNWYDVMSKVSGILWYISIDCLLNDTQRKSLINYFK